MADRFLPGVAERIGCYVYGLVDPQRGRIFYVGKGTGDRCFAHLAEARRTSADAVNGYEKLDRIREIDGAGLKVGVTLFRHGLDETEALLVESVLIDALGGLDDLTNRVTGHDAHSQGRMSAAEINARYASPVTIDPAHRVILIRINREYRAEMSDAELYQATRKFWRVGAPQREVGSTQAPKWAMAIYRGVVRAVYRIEGWERPTDADIAENPKRRVRWAFRGRRDPTMETQYLNRDVSSYLTSTGNPIQYLHLRQRLH